MTKTITVHPNNFGEASKALTTVQTQVEAALKAFQKNSTLPASAFSYRSGEAPGNYEQGLISSINCVTSIHVSLGILAGALKQVASAYTAHDTSTAQAIKAQK